MHLLVEDYLPNDDKTKNVFVKQERGGDRACSGLCRARRKKAEGQDKTHTISIT